MGLRRKRRRTYLEDLPALRIEDVRRMVGGRRRLAVATHVSVFLPDGRGVKLQLTRQPGVLGGSVVLFACPTCGRACRVLHVVPEEPGLTCNRCLQVACAAKYRSQTRPRSWVDRECEALRASPG